MDRECEEKMHIVRTKLMQIKKDLDRRYVNGWRPRKKKDGKEKAKEKINDLIGEINEWLRASKLF